MECNSRHAKILNLGLEKCGSKGKVRKPEKLLTCLESRKTVIPQTSLAKVRRWLHFQSEPVSRVTETTSLLRSMEVNTRPLLTSIMAADQATPMDSSVITTAKLIIFSAGDPSSETPDSILTFLLVDATSAQYETISSAADGIETCNIVPSWFLL